MIFAKGAWGSLYNNFHSWLKISVGCSRFIPYGYTPISLSRSPVSFVTLPNPVGHQRTQTAVSYILSKSCNAKELEIREVVGSTHFNTNPMPITDPTTHELSLSPTVSACHFSLTRFPVISLPLWPVCCTFLFWVFWKCGDTFKMSTLYAKPRCSIIFHSSLH